MVVVVIMVVGRRAGIGRAGRCFDGRTGNDR
jgi:hypothetical protein